MDQKETLTRAKLGASFNSSDYTFWYSKFKFVLIGSIGGALLFFK